MILLYTGTAPDYKKKRRGKGAYFVQKQSMNLLKQN